MTPWSSTGSHQLARRNVATPAFANNYLITPYGAYATPFGGEPFNATAGVGYNPYALGVGYGIGGVAASYGPYNQLPVGAYAAYPAARNSSRIASFVAKYTSQ